MKRYIPLLIIILIIGALIAAAVIPKQQGVMGSYITTLSGRTRGQRINALLSLSSIDGAVIAPGATFSFNNRVGSWSVDRGYVLAPVSYEGELVTDIGGGVCQTSSTLYNAALIAGMDIVKRTRHNWAPKYIPAGRDAAVAQQQVDLVIRNPYQYPVTIEKIDSEGMIGVKIVGKEKGPMAEITCESLSSTAPVDLIRHDNNLKPGNYRVKTRGRAGVKVTISRIFIKGKSAGQRQLISQDSYPAMNKVITVGE
ncbi:MAG: VanW family protein [bacterium]